MLQRTQLCRDHGVDTEAEEGFRSEQIHSPPIAIVGMALRLPGKVNTPDEFWKFLIEKKDGLCEVPGNRYSVDSFYSESKPHSVKTRKGYFLQDDPAQFDADFFSITPWEAARMDPQQRQLLEVVWECLESAGETNWQGKDIGCFVGVYGEDWLELASKDYESTDRYHVLGTGQFALSNRISYEYDFQGPSMTLQTGCSSSLVGLHEACQALYSGECSSAIVAGTNLILAPTMTTTMSDNMVLSTSGICRAFDEKADGYGRGEAINAVYIKRLSDAVRDGDNVRAVIRATSTNCDGRTPGITTPGSLSQERLVRRAYEKAQIKDITQTGFFECHGTGTTVGDTAEVSVVAKLFQEKGTVIGSVKPNVGHSEGASGITSLIKAVMSLEHGLIPPNIFFDKPNPKIPFEEANLQVPTSAMPWPSDRKKRISVNCFGIGGANAHAVLESATPYLGVKLEQPKDSISNFPSLIVLSARSAESLRQRIQGITRYINDNPAMLHDVAYTLAMRREHMQYRAFAVTQPNKPIDSSIFESSQTKSTGIVFVFTGQGAQWPGMGKDLMDNFPSFREDIQELDRFIQDLEDSPGWSLANELSKHESGSCINNAEFSQPLCTALQIGLVNLLGRLGVQPSGVVGHSSGEIAAAYAAKAITAKSAIILSYYRGRAVKCHEGKGSMVAMGIGRADVAPYLKAGVALACENSPCSVTLSGDSDAIHHATAKVKRDFPDAICRPLKVKTAYHSHHMLEAGNQYEPQISKHMNYQDTMLPLFSTVTSQAITDPRALDAAYWRRNLESPVLFVDAIREALKDSSVANQFLEIGPHSTLAGPLRQIFKSFPPKIDPIYIPTMTRYAEDSRSQMLYTLGCIHSNGGEVDFSAVNVHGKPVANLPPYPWQHETRHWYESRLATQWRYQNSPHHEILGVRVAQSSDIEPSWRNLLRLEDVPWLWDHVIQSNVVFPAAGYITMVGEAIRQLSSVEDYSVKNLALKSPLLLKDEQVFELITQLKPLSYNDSMDSKWYNFTIIAHDGTGWTKLCQGQVRPHYDHAPTAKEVERNIRPVNSAHWYRNLDRHGLSYGRKFQGLSDISVHPVKHQADATIADFEPSSSRYTLHPTVIDQCLQLLTVALANGVGRRIDRLAIPASIGHVYVRGQVPRMRLDAHMTKNNMGNWLGESNLVADGTHMLSLCNASFFSLQDESLNKSQIPLTAEIRWSPAMDFLQPSSWISSPQIAGRQHEVYSDFGKLTCLYLLETADQLAEINPTEAHMTRYKTWITTEAFKLRSGHNKLYPEWSDWIELSSKERRSAINQILSQYEDDEIYSGPALCMQEVNEGCLGFSTGEISSIDALMEDDKLLRYYNTPFQLPVWQQALQHLGHANPGMRVLEIGAGTGSGTKVALQGLQTPEGSPTYSEYVFTDLSPGFTIAAQEKFAAHRGLDFKVLDISRDPQDQGFDSHSFDLVIASNVLHATPHLKSALQNVHRLLSPNGKLLLHELFPQTLTTDYIMGVLPGWWVGENDDRVDRPYVSPERWDRELREAGFTGSEVYSYDVHPPFQQTFTMLSGISREPNDRRTIYLIFGAKKSAWARDVASIFERNGHSVKWATVDEVPPTDQDIVFLLDLEEPFIYQMQQQDFMAFQVYMSKIKTRVIWVTQSCQLNCSDPRYGLIFGFARTLRHEMGIDISTFETERFDKAAADSLYRVYDNIEMSRKIERLDPEYEFSYNDGVVHTGRCHWIPSKVSAKTSSGWDEKNVAKLDISSYALLDTLNWVETPQGSLENDQIEIEMRYVGLNFRDVMVAMGFVGDKSELGLEGSGIVRRVGPAVVGFYIGDQVAVIAPGSFQSRIITSPQQCVKTPHGMSLENAATMLTVYATSLYCLLEIGRLKKGQSVLIHSACGGVGLASIQICQHIGAEIFATVGSEEKVLHLMHHFGIPRNRIFNSRNSTFSPDVMRETNGRGVDLVLNSLAGELLHASWECVASRGKMIELGKRDLITNGILSMTPFGGNRSFQGVDLLNLCEECPDVVSELIAQAGNWYEQGYIKPIQPVTKFSAENVIDAFRFMQQGVHMGKILVEMPQEPTELQVLRSEFAVSFSSQASYLLVGGLGGLGRAVSTWMVENGARHLVYLSRSAGQSDEDQAFLKELEAQSCHAVCVQGSVTQLADVQAAVRKCVKPLAGVLQMSMTLKDRTFGKMTYEEWTSAIGPKVDGTWNLHHAVEKESLDFFIVFSSLSGTCGNIGQANYAAANTFLDSFTQYRRQLGLPSSAIALGPVEDIGLVSRDQKLLQGIRAGSTRFLDEGELMKCLQIAIAQCKPNNVKTGPVSSPVLAGLGNTKHTSDTTVRTAWTRDLRYAQYRNIESMGDTRAMVTSDHIKALIARVEQDPAILDDSQTEITICREMGKLITQHMNKTEELDDEQTAKIAIDSLMSIEIRGWARRNLGLEISLAEISKAGTVGALAKVAVEHLRIKYGRE